MRSVSSSNYWITAKKFLCFFRSTFNHVSIVLYLVCMIEVALVQEHSFDLQKNNFPTIPFLPLAWKSCVHNRFVSLVKMQCLVFLFGTWCLLLKGHSWKSVLCDKPKGCFKKPKNKEYWFFFYCFCSFLECLPTTCLKVLLINLQDVLHLVRVTK